VSRGPELPDHGWGGHGHGWGGLILTVQDDPIYERTARAAGADGFVLKKTAGRALWPALAPLVGTGSEGSKRSPARRCRRPIEGSAGLASGIFPIDDQGSARLADPAEPAIAPRRGTTELSRRAGWRGSRKGVSTADA